ncbi:hypothetical protein [Nocardia sp. NPDC058705]|uniref:hypothetical protein n=1 Tax=Nocardia sp. NPDC058705 TaxID=3346609 RepID=UPI003679CA7C
MTYPHEPRLPGMEVSHTHIGGDFNARLENHHYYPTAQPARRNRGRTFSWWLLITSAVSSGLHIWLAPQLDPTSSYYMITHFPDPLAQQILLVVCALALIVDAVITRGFHRFDQVPVILHRIILGVSLIAIAPVVAAASILVLTLALMVFMIYFSFRIMGMGNSPTNRRGSFFR